MYNCIMLDFTRFINAWTTATENIALKPSKYLTSYQICCNQLNPTISINPSVFLT